MLFTSSIFLFLFLPLALLVFFALAKKGKSPALTLWFLVFASFVFYGYADPENLLILIGSIVGNYALAFAIRHNARKKILFIIGIAFNVLLLGYFKYTNFILGNLTFMSGETFDALSIALPLAISFYTFQQIAYLADVKDGKIKDEGFLKYLLFVTFFPQLIIGPIMHYKEMVPQFSKKTFGHFNWEDLKFGYLFLISGLIKKVVLSDACASIADAAYVGGVDSEIGFAAAWVSTIAFSFQIYFDFSGYSDMALGIARMFGIKIPINFDSPYKAHNVSSFWRRWHMTFSRWLSERLYIPLGGSRKGPNRATFNAAIVFLIGGLWHGAAWTFVVWGVLQGLGLSASKYLERQNIYMPKALAIMGTFVFVTLTWVVFRAGNMHDALHIYGAMAGSNGFDMALPQAFKDHALAFTISAFLIFMAPNTHVLIPKIHHAVTYVKQAPVIALMLIVWITLLALDLDASPAFIYFEF